MNGTYFVGETVTYEIADGGYSSVILHVGTQNFTAALSGCVWTATFSTETMEGMYRYAAFCDGRVRDSGSVYVRPLVSKYRAVVEAIDAALQGVARNGKYSVSVGEITVQDKTFDEMVKARSYYSRLAEADENGVVAAFAPRRVSEVYE